MLWVPADTFGREAERRPFVMVSPGPVPPCLPVKAGGRAGAGGEPRRPGDDEGARGRPLLRGISQITFIAPVGLVCPLTRIHVGLLGPCFKTGWEEYRLFARCEGQHKDRVGEGEAREARPPERRLGLTVASDPTPVLGRPRRDRRGSKTRAPGDPWTGAKENNPRPTSQAGAERAAGSYPSSLRVAATYCGGKIAHPVKAPSARGLWNGKSQHARYRLPAG